MKNDHSGSFHREKPTGIADIAPIKSTTSMLKKYDRKALLKMIGWNYWMAVIGKSIT